MGHIRTLQPLDHRSLAGRHVAATREKLVDFVGGNPTEPEKEIISCCAMLSLQIAQMDRRIAAGDTFTEHDSASYLDWTNTFCKILKILKMLPQQLYS